LHAEKIPRRGRTGPAGDFRCAETSTQINTIKKRKEKKEKRKEKKSPATRDEPGGRVERKRKKKEKDGPGRISPRGKSWPPDRKKEKRGKKNSRKMICYNSFFWSRNLRNNK